MWVKLGFTCSSMAVRYREHGTHDLSPNPARSQAPEAQPSIARSTSTSDEHHSSRSNLINVPCIAMVNYSKWDNLDSGDSDSDDGPPPRTEAQRRQLQAQGQQQQRNGGDDKRSLVQAELLRYGTPGCREEGNCRDALRHRQ